jgi:hypothetical protein
MASGTQASTTRQAPQRQNFLAILWRSLRLYGKHLKAWTGVLIWPVAQIFLGVYISLNLCLMVMDIPPPFLAKFSGLILGGLVLMMGFSASLLMRGAWQYMIYWASLCINAWEAEQDAPLDFKGAYQKLLQNKKMAYGILTATYFSLPLITLMPILVVSLLGVMWGQGALDIFLLAGFLLSLFLILIWLFSLIALSFIFQIAAFENGIPINPIPVFAHSLKLTLKRFGSVFLLQILTALITNCLIPQPLVWLARITHLSAPLDGLHQKLIQSMISGNEALWRESPWLADTLFSNPTVLQLFAQVLSDLCLASLITMMLLPLGTLIFTFLYKDILKCDRSKKTRIGI